MNNYKIRKSDSYPNDPYLLIIDEERISFFYHFNLKDYYFVGTNFDLIDGSHYGEIQSISELEDDVIDMMNRIIHETKNERLVYHIYCEGSNAS